MLSHNEIEIIEKFSTAVPLSNNSELHKISKKCIKTKLINQLEFVAKNLKINLETLITNAHEINVDKNFSPEFYFKIFELGESITSKNVTKILNATKAIENIIYSYWVEPKIKIESILSEEWEKSYVKIMRQYDQTNIRGERTIVRPLVGIDISEHIKNINKALDYIKKYNPEIYNEYLEFTTSIKLFRGRVLRGETSAKSFGVIWLRVPAKEDDQVGYWIEHLVHEVSHLRLEAHFFAENLVLNPYSHKEFIAPIRDDLRPMFGIFHATFVLSRMVRAFRLISLAGEDARFRDRLQLCLLQFEKGLASVYSEKALLSPNALKIRDSFKECAYIQKMS